MNKERKGRFNDVISSLEEAKGELEDILNEEQDSYDSLRWITNVFQRRKDAGLHLLDGGLYKQDR